ncbi:methyltransferase family protein [Pajaroellobacter abortibovis]|uniref:Steroid 5-alpha reductase C-terminal domain-containing protein n=1 Tax=Pajaroellobacter abortibovis TaxID=1882918 RepID=A0A1L6MZ26_9BACT|nr:isoprenylcysteine carboxylmethyltransferase family protein [Pajaroellobacter abortibovis]APS00739.1 hypothetical protein BCY86_08655 [Pajaroellobacter abortibovis]
MKPLVFSILFIFLPMIGNPHRMLHPGPWILTLAIWAILITHPPLPTIKEIIHNQSDCLSAIYILIALGITTLSAILEFTYRSITTPSPWSITCISGIALMGGAIFLRVWTINILGKFFTSTVNDDGSPWELIEEGPYHFVRHPSYLSILLAFVASFLMLRSTLCIVLTCLLVLPSYLYRIHREELFLQAKLRTKYQIYQQHTWKLIPFLL